MVKRSWKLKLYCHHHNSKWRPKLKAKKSKYCQGHYEWRHYEWREKIHFIWYCLKSLLTHIGPHLRNNGGRRWCWRGGLDHMCHHMGENVGTHRWTVWSLLMTRCDGCGDDVVRDHHTVRSLTVNKGWQVWWPLRHTTLLLLFSLSLQTGIDCRKTEGNSGKTVA